MKKLYKKFPKTIYLLVVLLLLTAFVVGSALWHPLGWVLIALAAAWVVGSAIRDDIKTMRSKP